MARGEQNLNDPQDGADEKMLGSDDKSTLALKDIEVKFISGDKNTNGDAKIDIGNIDKVNNYFLWIFHTTQIFTFFIHDLFHSLPINQFSHIFRYKLAVNLSKFISIIEIAVSISFS